jgi:beta-glucanase (GH16 family)
MIRSVSRSGFSIVAAVLAPLCGAACSGSPSEQESSSDPESLTTTCSSNVTTNTYDGPNYWGTIAVKNTTASAWSGFAITFQVPSGAHCTNDAVPSGARLSPLNGRGSSATTRSNTCTFTWTTSLAAGATKTFNYSTDSNSFHAATNVTARSASCGGASSSSSSGGGSGSSSGSPTDAGIPGWTLVWSDEFDGPNGSDVDPTKWVHDVGDGSKVKEGVWEPGNGWGNDELQYYTAGNANTQQQDGNLVITAKTAGASAYGCWYGTCQWTSGRIKTYLGPPAVQNLFSRTYGRFEMRAQIPAGQGVWPAFWMMGTKLFTSDWPACGELDVMESVGDTPGTVYGTSHSTASGDEGVSFSYVLPGNAHLSDAYHVYALEWSATQLTWYLDDHVYGSQTVPAGATATNWPFADPSDPFFLIVNLALSNGDSNSWGKPPNAATSNPAEMKIDYVRVYTQN